MSRSTPRKSRQPNQQHHHHQRQQSSQRILPVSDYESDAAHYMESRPPPPAPELLHRTNTDLNLGVLRRYLPSISAILSIAANAVVYTFSPETQGWDKPGVEGTMFVCTQAAGGNGSGNGGGGNNTTGGACVFVLNRRGLHNVVIDLARVAECEVTPELLIFRLERQPGDAGADDDGAELNVLGLWIHADEDHTRETNGKLVYETWREVREGARKASASARAAAGGVDYGAPALSAGRQLSLTEIFGNRNGGTGR